MMIWLVGFVVYLYVLSKPLYSLSEHFFWSSMELASIRDPKLYDAVVASMSGEALFRD